MSKNFLHRTACAIIFLWLGLESSMALTSDKFLLLNYSPDGFSTLASSSTIMNYVAQKFGATNQTSSIKVGVACIYYAAEYAPTPQNEINLLRSDLARAQSLNIPILVQVDTESWLPTNLLNWYDPTLAGYDPAKKQDVEWFGWDSSTAVDLCWRNWGSEMRIGPAPNFLSTNYQAFEKSLYDQFLPVVLQWFTNLPPNKKWLFVGWKCGWESALNGNYRFFTNGNSFYSIPSTNPPWSNNYQQLGYNAAQTAGIEISGTLTMSDDAKIVGRHLTYLASLAAAAGVPRDKIFVHGTTYTTYQQNSDALVNCSANPGASFYGSSTRPLKSNKAFIQAVHAAEANYGATGYSYGEFNLSTTNYNTWFNWFTNALGGDPDCIYQGLYNYDSVYQVTSVEQALLTAMTLYPEPLTPTIPLQPASIVAEQSSNVVLTVSATGAGVLSYQWQFDQTPIIGAITTNYVVNNIQTTNAGNYSVVVSNSFGGTTSQLAFVSVQTPLTNPPGCILAPNGLVDWWTADGNPDDIATGNITGRPKNGFSYVTGESGTAFHFDGSTSCLNLLATNIPASWTVCVWVKRENASGNSAVLIGDGTNSLNLEQYNGTRKIGLSLGAATYLFTPNYIAPLGTWVHLAFVGNSASTALYVNGVSNGVVSAGISLPRAYIGASYSIVAGQNTNFIAGSLDDFLIFNRALSAAEIASIYSVGAAGFYRAPQIAGIYMNSGQIELNLLGLTGKSFTVYSSTNFVDWTSLASLPNPSGTNQFIDANSGTAQFEFYRAYQP